MNNISILPLVLFVFVISSCSVPVHSGPVEEHGKSEGEREEQPELKDYISSCAALINSYRAKHGSPPCSFNLNAAAASCAKMYAGGAAWHTCPQSKGLGENTAKGSGITVEQLCTIGVNTWYAEKSQYNYNNPNINAWHTTGHFTYMIWKSSTSCGIGCAKGSSVQCVALFRPAGNTPSVAAYKANVGPPRKEEQEEDRKELENQLALIQKYNVTIN